ncbi:hypothetical protein F4824DRAFT_107821 [Ustulina deusta]|nr:hypothetical protein F4824DRAFT_107821 [Ustulina deusta]
MAWRFRDTHTDPSTKALTRLNLLFHNNDETKRAWNHLPAIIERIAARRVVKSHLGVIVDYGISNAELVRRLRLGGCSLHPGEGCHNRCHSGNYDGRLRVLRQTVVRRLQPEEKRQGLCMR